MFDILDILDLATYALPTHTAPLTVATLTSFQYSPHVLIVDWTGIDKRAMVSILEVNVPRSCYGPLTWLVA